MEVLGCVGLALVAVMLGLGLAHSIRAKRSPMMFAQATVVAVEQGNVTFRLFDGQEMKLTAAQLCLREGDYGRLTYQGKRCREFQKM